MTRSNDDLRGSTMEDAQLRMMRSEPVVGLTGIAAVTQALRLREQDLTYRAISTVMRVYHGVERSENAWRHMLRTHGAAPLAYADGSQRVTPQMRALEQDKFVTGELRTAGQLVESRPESTRGEPTEGGCDARLLTPTPWGQS